MKFTIFHFSDSHWYPRWINPETNEKHTPPPDIVNFYQEYVSDFESLDLKHYYGDTTVLVHTGDFAHFPSRSENIPIPPIKEMFEDIALRHIPTFERKFSDVDDKLAVPGNHDADRVALEEDHRFACFCTSLGPDWKTPFNMPVARYPIKDFGDKQMALFLFNSVSATEDKATGQMYPAIAIDHEAMKKPPDTDYFRIALLHHNLLPHYGQRANRNVFVNSGNFNSHLGDNNFKLVLSGHQHLGNEMLFAVPTRLGKSDFARPTLESVFLTIAAPSFLRTERGVLTGFNIIEVELTNESNFATITLHRFRYSRERHPSGFKIPRGIVFQLLIPRIDSGTTLPQHEQERRIRVARKVVDSFYDSDFDITRIEDLVFPFARTGHFRKMRRALQACQESRNNIAALYSVAVLPPSYWWQAEPAFRRLFIDNVGRASARSASEDVIKTYQFPITAPLADAIQNARLNASALSIAGDLRQRKRDVGQWCEARLLSDLANTASLSVWELEDYRKGDKLVTRGIRLEPSGNEIMQTVVEWDKCNSPQTLEIARIAIWPLHFFDDPDAARVIELHEDYLVPLFWLNPDRLRAPINSEGTRQERQQWGYDLIYARRYREPNATGQTFMDHERPLRFINDNLGKHPKRKFNEERADAYADDLWGPGGAPAHYRKHDTHLSAEFSALLRRPDILFAVDAYAMRRADFLEDITSALYRMHGFCDDWLNQ